MKSYQQIYEDYQSLTGISNATEKALAQKLINATQATVLGLSSWLLEHTDTDTTVASQNNYEIPHKMRTITSVIVTLAGGTIYRPKPVYDSKYWDYLQSLQYSASDVAQYYYVENNEIKLFPKPATAGSTITFRGKKRVKDLSFDDYSTGTITTATLADETIVGDSTVWTGQKPVDGQWLRIDGGAQLGDFEWYEVDSITDNTHLELIKPYQGTSIAAGTSTYELNEFSVIPSEYHDLLLWRPLAIYYMQNEKDVSRADRFFGLYDGGYEAGRAPRIGGLLGRMLDENHKNEGVYMEREEEGFVDVNNPPQNIDGENW